MAKRFLSPARIGVAAALSAVAIVGLAAVIMSPGSTGSGSTGSGSTGSGSTGSGSTGSGSTGSGEPASATANQTPPKPVETTQGRVDPTRPSNGKQVSVLDKLPGATAAASGCVTVGAETDVRAGTIAVGNWADARAQFKKTAASQSQPEVNLYVIPSNALAKDATLQVAQAGASKPARTATTTIQQKAEDWTYFALRVTVPGPGTWRFTAISGTDKGCFDVTFTK